MIPCVSSSVTRLGSTSRVPGLVQFVIQLIKSPDQVPISAVWRLGWFSFVHCPRADRACSIPVPLFPNTLLPSHMLLLWISAKLHCHLAWVVTGIGFFLLHPSSRCRCLLSCRRHSCGDNPGGSVLLEKAELGSAAGTMVDLRRNLSSSVPLFICRLKITLGSQGCQSLVRINVCRVL